MTRGAALTKPPPSTRSSTSGDNTRSRPSMSPPAVAPRNARTTSSCWWEETCARLPRRTWRRADVASCLVAAAERPTTPAISSNGTPNTSCSTNVTRSAGVMASRTVSNAMLTASSRVTRSSGSAARWLEFSGATAVSAKRSAGTGSGSHCPTYVSRRARAEPSRSSEMRLATRISHAAGVTILSRSSGSRRYHLTYVSCTTSSASARVPIMRKASDSRRCRSAMTESRARDSSGSAFPDSADSKGISSGMGPFLMGARHG
ncbi:hypothetical protein SUDANB130_06473 [Streptomyces sp. enrichment culture]